jgi:hypothetical protein
MKIPPLNFSRNPAVHSPASHLERDSRFSFILTPFSPAPLTFYFALSRGWSRLVRLFQKRKEEIDTKKTIDHEKLAQEAARYLDKLRKRVGLVPGRDLREPLWGALCSFTFTIFAKAAVRRKPVIQKKDDYAVMGSLLREHLSHSKGDIRYEAARSYRALISYLPDGHPEHLKGWTSLPRRFDEEIPLCIEAVKAFIALMHRLPTGQKEFLQGLDKLFLVFETRDLWTNLSTLENYVSLLSRLPENHPEIVKIMKRIERLPEFSRREKGIVTCHRMLQRRITS